MIGERIHTRRQELSLSLRDLAQQTDLTASYLSQVERDMTDPSIKSLRKIADALKVPIMYFLDEETEAPNPVIRKDQRKKLSVPSSHVEYELLTPDLDRKMEMFMCRLQPDEANIAAPLRSPTEECLLVLRGCICIELEETAHELHEGDSIYFEGQKLAKIYAKGTEETVFVSAITPAVF
jgi:transcriptional regulator with XRE-family HTH domain